jgi:hypothetical protein
MHNVEQHRDREKMFIYLGLTAMNNEPKEWAAWNLIRHQIKNTTYKFCINIVYTAKIITVQRYDILYYVYSQIYRRPRQNMDP